MNGENSVNAAETPEGVVDERPASGRIWAIKIDETGHWGDSDLIRRCGGRIFGVYLYDDGIGVHCCELTASYELYFLESQAFRYPEEEHENERVVDDLREADRDTPEVMYLHCHAVDSVPVIENTEMPKGSAGRFLLGRDGKFEVEEGEENDSGEPATPMDLAKEWVRGNSV